MVNFSHLHYNLIQRTYEAISGWNNKIARNGLTYMLDCIVMQMRKPNRDKNYSQSLAWAWATCAEIAFASFFTAHHKQI